MLIIVINITSVTSRIRDSDSSDSFSINKNIESATSMFGGKMESDITGGCRVRVIYQINITKPMIICRESICCRIRWG